jgi:hydroxyacylglutathione hydrolase
MRFEIVPVTPLQQNCTIFGCPETLEAAVIDPGGDVDRIIAAIGRTGLRPTHILLTHGHIDHAGGAGELGARLDLPVIGPHRDDAFWLDALPDQARMFGLPDSLPLKPERWLEGGETVRIGAQTLEVLHCPGHTPGHVVFFHRPSGLAQVGDCLFRGSIGRTDFPRGNHHDLLRSIREVLFPLGDAVRFIPGHGPMSTFGEERRSNPFVGDAAID